MGKPREFMCVPARAIADTRLTALDLRCLMAVAIHDGMSLAKGGAGCYAKVATLAEMARTDISNCSKSISRLLKHDYLVKEAQQNDKRRSTLRVIYGDDDSWRSDQQYGDRAEPEIVGEFTNNLPGKNVGELTNDRPKMVGETTNYRRQIVGDGEYLSDGNSNGKEAQYIPLNGEIDFDESRKIYSSEEAQLAERELRSGSRDWSKSLTRSASKAIQKNGAKASATRWILQNHLPANFNSLGDGAKVAKLEKAFKAIGEDAELMPSRERETYAELLSGIVEFYANENPAISNQAQRIYEELLPW